MDQISYKRFIRNAFTNKTYLPTYLAFGTGAVIALIYMSDWETVGRHIPLWKYHFPPAETSETDKRSNETATPT
ncbi:unnamed protein product [Gongylonema pulchrum]|uniref:Cytochrome b-c1 complex subunit 10 n=1 Tax=Gongylonema pulchrum TaxID=637853 RepID=A0A183EK98_9BILA|nr:unnamed protein product [Gongylonema pulchrum]